MAELIAFFSRGDENYVNGEIKNLGGETRRLQLASSGG